MSKSLQIFDLPDSDELQLSLNNHNGAMVAPPTSFMRHLPTTNWEDINWYFRDYLQSPFGKAKARAEHVETGFRNMGRILFEVVFRGNEEARRIYTAASEDGLAEYQLSIISRRPEFLTLPWELLNESEAGYIAPKLAGVVRGTGIVPIPNFPQSKISEQLNVLLVAPMPFLTEHGPPNTLFPEVLIVLESLKVIVQLDYLRPRTITAFSKHLAQRVGHYHLVQFDDITSVNPGALILESEEHLPDRIPALRIAELLVAAEVPMVLLSGNSSGIPNNPTSWAATCSQLLDGGVPAVAALPFPLFGTARNQFLNRFYRSLAQGSELALCVANARRDLMDNPNRNAAARNIVFWDWSTPVVYQSKSLSPPVIQEHQPAQIDSQSTTKEPSYAELQIPKGGRFGLVGRSKEMRILERLLEGDSVVLLTGTIGTGKTELALGFANWLHKTGGTPGGVYYSTFDIGAGLVRIIHEIGTSVVGLPFTDLNAEKQRQWVIEYLSRRQSLLIWDSLEYAAGFPSGTKGTLDEKELLELDEFLWTVGQDGQTKSLLISLKEEKWLSAPHVQHELYGLNQHDRVALSNILIETIGLQPENLESKHHELLDRVEGHPLAMHVALPLLKQVPAAVLLRKLDENIAQLPKGTQEEANNSCLTALIEYSFAHMSSRTRAHLPFLAMFNKRIMMDIFSHMAQSQFYRSIMGEELGWGACRTLLRSARDAGFLDEITPSVYQIHSAFPSFFKRKLRQLLPPSSFRSLELEVVDIYAGTAGYFMDTLYDDQTAVATAVLAEEGNLTQALDLALINRQWDNAQLLVQPLVQVFRMQKRHQELNRLRDHLSQYVGLTSEEAQARGAIEIWLYILGTAANEAFDLLNLDHAEQLNRQLLQYLETRPDQDFDQRTAAIYHQFGIIAIHKQYLTEAEDWLHKSLTIVEMSEDRAAVAFDYYALGQVKQYQRLYSEAREFFRKALAIQQGLHDNEEIVNVLRALGSVSKLDAQLKEAEDWLHQARTIVEQIRDENTATLVFHELGTVYHSQFLFDDAARWYQQALTLSDRLGMESQMAVEFHYLGLLSQSQGNYYEDAENWFLLALEKRQKLGQQKGAGEECRQLGVLFHEQKRLDEAEQWYDRAREIFETLPDYQAAARTYGQLSIIYEERNDLPTALKWVTKTYLIAIERNLPLLVQAKTHLSRLRNKFGRKSFNRWWHDNNNSEPPSELDDNTEANQ